MGGTEDAVIDLTPIESPGIRSTISTGANNLLTAGAMLVIAAILALAVAPAALMGMGAASSEPSEIVRKGLDLMYSATVVTPGSRASDVSAEALASHAKGIPSRMENYFTGEALKGLTEALEFATGEQIKSNVRDTAGGAKSVDIVEVQIDGAVARISARALIRLKTEPQDDKGPAAIDTEDWWLYDLHLVKLDVGWRIDQVESVPEGGI